MAIGQFMPRYAGSPKKKLAWSLTGTYVATKSSTVTVTGVDFGPASSNRLIVIATGTVGANRAINSATIGGVAATVIRATAASASDAFLLYAVVPTGVSGTVQIVFSGAPVEDIGLIVYSIVNASSPPIVTAGSTSVGSSSTQRTSTGSAAGQSVLVAGSSSDGQNMAVDPWGGALTEGISMEPARRAYLYAAAGLIPPGAYSVTHSGARTLLSIAVR